MSWAGPVSRLDISACLLITTNYTGISDPLKNRVESFVCTSPTGQHFFTTKFHTTTRLIIEKYAFPVKCDE